MDSMCIKSDLACQVLTCWVSHFSCELVTWGVSAGSGPEGFEAVVALKPLTVLQGFSMTRDESTLAVFRAFDRVLTSLVSKPIWQNQELKVGFWISGGPGIHVHDKAFPDLDRLRSLIMDFRQLLNQKDLSNFIRTCKEVCRNQVRDGWSADEVATVKEARKQFNKALDQKAEYFRAGPKQQKPTARMLLDDWMFGEWFHGDEERRRRRMNYELINGDDLSLGLIIPAVHDAIRAAIRVHAVIKMRFGSALETMPSAELD
jgi:hypothetical protein